MRRYLHRCPKCGERDSDTMRDAKCPDCGARMKRIYASTPLPSTCHPTKGT